MSSPILWIGLFGLLLPCFLLAGAFIPSLAGPFFVILPLAITIIIGYFSKSIEDTFKIVILGLLIAGIISLIPFGILSTSITTDEEIWVISMIWVRFFVTQIPLTIVGVILALFLKKVPRIIWLPKERIRTYGDFTSEGVTRTGVVKVRIIGTVPEELVEWMQKEIEAGNYVNQSHIIEVALKQLKETRNPKK